MIFKVKLLKNVGKFYDYAAKGDGLDLHKNTFIFAPNAFGNSILVAGIEAEQALVEANRKLAEIFEKKIQDKLAEIWGEENGRKKGQNAQE